MKDDKGRQVSYDMFQNGGPDYDGDGLINGDELVWDSIYDNSNRPFNHKYGWVMISNPVQWNYPYWAQGLLKKNLPEDLSYSDYEASIKRLVQKQISGNRLDAIKYAINNYDNYDSHGTYQLLPSGNDCANFVSNILNNGGFEQNKDWYFHGIEDYDEYNPRHWFDMKIINASSSLIDAEGLLYYLKDTKGFKEYTVNTKSQIYEHAKNGDIVPGDVVIMMHSHAVFITDVDTKTGKVYYTAHTESRLMKDLDYYYSKEQGHDEGEANIHLIHIVYPDEV